MGFDAVDVKSFVGLFGIAALFGLVIAVTYFFVAHEEGAGTALLAVMATALTFAAGYAVLAERDANVEGDDPNQSSEEVAGDDLGVFTVASPWPILIALCTLATTHGDALVAFTRSRGPRRNAALLLAARRRKRAGLS